MARKTNGWIQPQNGGFWFRWLAPFSKRVGFSGSMSIILGTVPLLYLVFVCSFSKILTTKIITIITDMFVISWSSGRKSMFSFQSLPSGKLTWQEKMDLLKMYSVLKMGIFHCCQEGVFICDFQPYIPPIFFGPSWCFPPERPETSQGCEWSLRNLKTRISPKSESDTKRVFFWNCWNAAWDELFALFFFRGESEKCQEDSRIEITLLFVRMLLYPFLGTNISRLWKRNIHLPGNLSRGCVSSLEGTSKGY